MFKIESPLADQINWEIAAQAPILELRTFLEHTAKFINPCRGEAGGATGPARARLTAWPRKPK